MSKSELGPCAQITHSLSKTLISGWLWILEGYNSSHTIKPSLTLPDTVACIAIVIPTVVPKTLSAASNFRLEVDPAHCVQDEASSKVIELKVGREWWQAMVAVWKQPVTYMEKGNASDREQDWMSVRRNLSIPRENQSILFLQTMVNRVKNAKLHRRVVGQLVCISAAHRKLKHEFLRGTRFQ